jgi:hypothetical protein
VGIAKALFVGTTLNVAGASTLAGITGTFNGTVGATTPSTGAFTTLTTTGTINLLTVGRGAGAVATNTAVGASALAANTSGVEITAIGFNALTLNTGSYNTAFGAYNLNSNTTGTNNSAFGDGPLGYNISGSNNTALGMEALKFNTTASNNTAVGYQAGYLSTGAGNQFFGYSSGSAVTSGAKNVILGSYTGSAAPISATGSNYIVLSDGDGNPAAYRSNVGLWTFGLGGTTASSYEGIISLNAANTTGRGPAIQGLTNGTNNWYLGAYSYVVGGAANGFFAVANSGGGGVYLNGSSATSWTAVSDETRKVIIEPITDAANKVSTLRAVIGRLKSDDETVRRPYLIAQDVQAVLPEAVSESEDKEGAVLGLSYTEVIPLLVAAINELKAEVDSLKAQINGASA